MVVSQGPWKIHELKRRSLINWPALLGMAIILQFDEVIYHQELLIPYMQMLMFTYHAFHQP